MLSFSTVQLLILVSVISAESNDGNSSDVKVGLNELDCKPRIPPAPPLSHIYLTRLAKTEASLHESLHQLLNSLQSENEEMLRIHIQRFLEDYNGSSGIVSRETGLEWTSRIAENPLLVFRMIFRFVIDLNPIEAELGKYEDANAVAVLQILQTLVNDSLKPNLDNLEDAIERLLVIMLTYDLPVSDVASGVFRNISTGFILERRHCVAIGEYASQKGYHAFAVEWVKFAQEMQEDTETEELLQRLILKHDEGWENENQSHYTEYKFFMDKIHGGGSQQIRRRTSRDKGTSKLLKYYGTCGGRNYQSEETKSELTCWYDWKTHPEFRISPLKVELLSKSPLLLQIYELITKGDAQELIAITEPLLEISMVREHDYALKKEVITKSSDRTSFTTFVGKKQSAAAERFSERTHRITKLDPGHTPLQVGTYTFGGKFDLHYDSSGKKHADQYEEAEYRWSTFMVYLTDAEGGYTSFPHLGVGVKPVAGSGIFWYNLYDDGEEDLDLLHAGCPVILGPSKWIATMWVYVKPKKYECGAPPQG